MNNPALYSRASGIQRSGAKEIVDEYASTLKLHSAGKETLLDVGTGSGDVLMEILVPVLAPGFKRIVGIDISPNMVAHSAENYAKGEEVVFKELDIETEHLPEEYHGQFDRVASSYCLHWIRNQRKSVENIFKCLRSHGDCLVLFPDSNSIFDAYRLLSKESTWKEYITDPSEYFSCLLDHPQIEEEYASILQQEGFIDAKVEIKQKSFAFDGMRIFKDSMKAITPYPLPASLYEKFFDDLCDSFRAMGLRERIPDSQDHRFILNYRLVVAYARKGE